VAKLPRNSAEFTRQNRPRPRAFKDGLSAGASNLKVVGRLDVTRPSLPPARTKRKTNPDKARKSSAVSYSLPMTASTCSSGSDEMRNTPE